RSRPNDRALERTRERPAEAGLLLLLELQEHPAEPGRYARRGLEGRADLRGVQPADELQAADLDRDLAERGERVDVGCPRLMIQIVGVTDPQEVEACLALPETTGRQLDVLTGQGQDLPEMLDLIPGALILLEGGRQLVGHGQLQPLVFLLLQA